MSANMFANAAKKASKQQEEVKQAVNADTADDEKTVIQLTITNSDKKFLKMYALENNTTVSALLHDYAVILRNS